MSFQDEEREKKEKEAEERRAKEAQKEAEERAKEAHQALLKHFTVHTSVMMSFKTYMLPAFESPNRPFTGITLSTHRVWDRLQHISCGPAGTEIGRSKGQGGGVDVTPAGCCCGGGWNQLPILQCLVHHVFFSAQTMCVLAK